MRAEVADPRPAPPQAGGRGGFGGRSRRSASRAATERFVAAYSDREAGVFTEPREFMGRTFHLQGESTRYPWRLVGEEHEFLGFLVHKAITVVDGTTVEAWFSPEIPVVLGPGPYGGLPGLILVVSVDRGRELYSATEVHIGEVSEPIGAPEEEGDVITPDAYEALVLERLAELQARGRGPGES